MSEDIDEPLEQAVQHAMALSAQVGRELARAWKNHLEDKARRDERTATLVQAAFNKEREVAAATLAPVHTPEWWDEAKVPEILNAYEVSNAWAEHDSRAAQAEETLRNAAAERYGFDPQKLLREGHEFTEHLKNTDPARLAGAQRWARLSHWEGPPSYYPEAQKIRNLLRDYDAAVAADERNAPRLEAAAEQGKDHAAALERDAEQIAPSDLEAARAWAMANDPEYAEKTTAEKDRLDRELVEHWKGSGDPEKAAQAAEVRRDARQRKEAGDKAAAAAGAAYDRAAQLEADAERMRAAGVPEKAIAAKQFGEAQQKFPVAHAAGGRGKTIGKVKANAVQQASTQGKHLTKGR